MLYKDLRILYSHEKRNLSNGQLSLVSIWSLWVFMGRWGSLGLLSLCRSFTIAEGLSGRWVFFLLFLLRVFQDRWNRTRFYLSDPRRLSLSGSLWVAEGPRRSLPIFQLCFRLSFTIFQGLSQNCENLSNPQRLTKTIWKPGFMENLERNCFYRIMHVPFWLISWHSK